LIDGDEEKADEILKVSRLVVSYSQFKSAINLGLTVNLGDIPFEKAMVFSWIKEVLEDG
jgi:hypothetical protein